MAELGFEFDADTEKTPSRDPLPPGLYEVVIAESEWKETKNGNGRYLNITFTIISGEYQNRKLWSRLNLDNPNPDAVTFARQDMAAICKAVGVPKPTDTVQLHDVPLIVRVVQKPDKMTGEVRNEIKDYKPRGEANPGTNPTSPTTSSPAAPKNQGSALPKTAPWTKK